MNCELGAVSKPVRRALRHQHNFQASIVALRNILCLIVVGGHIWNIDTRQLPGVHKDIVLNGIVEGHHLVPHPIDVLRALDCMPLTSVTAFTAASVR